MNQCMGGLRRALAGMLAGASLLGAPSSNAEETNLVERSIQELNQLPFEQLPEAVQFTAAAIVWE